MLVASLLGFSSGACDKGPAAPQPTEAQTNGAPPLASKPFYRIDAGPLAPCAVGGTCEATLVLTALADYRVNAGYPTKFVPDAASEVAIASHAFAREGEQRGTLTVKFKPKQAGAAKLVGVFKLSVCNEENCEIEAPQITLPVTSS
ncbi:MAG TPA: hypothetical protein VK427_04365 [Kofleriaceae bacterium]|nr:hypothetical protein [Kofleriaceae bacterium]